MKNPGRIGCPQNPTRQGMPLRSQSVSLVSAFTVMEMIVSITIVLVLSVVGYSLVQSSIRAARQSVDIAAIRRVYQGYINASMDRNGIFPMAYDEMTPISKLNFTYPNGQTLLDRVKQGVIVQRLPWRLDPYIGWNMEKSMVTWVNKEPLSKQPAQYHYGVSINPAFGVNAYGVGGYSWITQYSESAQRMTDVPSPARLVAFTAATSFYVRPPNVWKTNLDKEDPGWKEQDPEKVPTAQDASRYGGIRFDYSGKTIVCFLDGHVELMESRALRDSRLWSRISQRLDTPTRAISP